MMASEPGANHEFATREPETERPLDAAAEERPLVSADPHGEAPPESEELDDRLADDYDVSDYDSQADARPLEVLADEPVADEAVEMKWYILKVQVNRENSICEALARQVKVAGLERYFADILVPTEDVREYNKSGKQRIVKRKLFPGYIVVQMHVCDESWFLVRNTPGIGDFTGAAGKPVPLSESEVSRIIATSRPDVKTAEEVVKTAIRFKPGDRVRVKEGYFLNYEGEVSNIDERNGRVTVMINIFGRPNPVELDHWQIEEM